MTNDAVSSYPTSSWADWVPMRLVGRDAAEWLNGQCTQAVAAVPAAPCLETGFCDERGRVWAFGFLTVRSGEVVLALDRSRVGRFEQTVEERVILEDVRLEKLDGVVARLAPEPDPAAVLAVPAGRWWLSLSTSGAAESAVDRDAAEIALGWPGAAEFAQAPLVQELGQEFLSRAVSFSKGCYVGQEIVARVQSRGRVHRRWVALTVPKPLAAGATVLAASGREAAVLRQGRLPDDRWICSALLSIEDAVPGQIVAVKSGERVLEASIAVPGRIDLP